MEATAADLGIRMEAASEAAKFSRRGMKDAVEEAGVNAAATKATTFLSFLVRVRTDRCAIF